MDHNSASPHLVVLDCDGGSDDAWALLLLLKADEEKKLVLLGITISGCGNTTLQNAAHNMMRILKALGREEIPIFLGASEPMIPPPSDKNDPRVFFHGQDGFGDILHMDEDIDVVEIAEREHAVTAIYQFCLENPSKVTIVVVGPLTNLALCFSMYNKKFADNVKSIYIMGGNWRGVGNCTRSAEFNFYSDPEAAFIVLARATCPVTILPWETCIDDKYSISIKWRLREFGVEAAKNNEVVRLLNIIEETQWSVTTFTTWSPCDAMLVAAYLFGSQIILKESSWHATVDLTGHHTRGQMVLDHLQETYKYPRNVRIIEQIDGTAFQNVVRWATNLPVEKSLTLSIDEIYENKQDPVRFKKSNGSIE